MKALLLVLVMVLLALPVTAVAANEPCSVERKCSSSGIDCSSDDRKCADRAVADGLEVACERASDGERRFVYCPPGGNQRDSSYVWLLLALAVTIAVGGSVIAWVALRKRA